MTIYIVIKLSLQFLSESDSGILSTSTIPVEKIWAYSIFAILFEQIRLFINATLHFKTNLIEIIIFV